MAELVGVEERRINYKQVFCVVRNTWNSPEASKKRQGGLDNDQKASEANSDEFNREKAGEEFVIR